MLGTDGKTDGIGFNILLGQFFFTELAVGGGSWMDDQALHICHIGKQGENLQIVNKPVSLLYAALDFKCKNRTASIRKIFLVLFMVRMVRQRGMINLFNLLVVP